MSPVTCNQCGSTDLLMIEAFDDGESASGDQVFDCLIKCNSCTDSDWQTLKEEEYNSIPHSEE